MTDLLNAFRVWRRRPLVAAAVVLTFALGAGANLAVFRFIWAVMLRPLPYADASRLVQVWQDDGKDARKASDKQLIEQWREDNRSFESLTNFRPWQLTVASGGGEPENVRAGLVSAEFFAMLGVAMQAGRAFTPEETRAGTDRAIILTHGYWTRRFSADHTILNREILADGEMARVVGFCRRSSAASSWAVRVKCGRVYARLEGTLRSVHAAHEFCRRPLEARCHARTGAGVSGGDRRRGAEARLWRCSQACLDFAASR